MKLLKKSSRSRARIGEITTAHGSFRTPIFMPPGTRATVKALGPDDLEDIGIEILLVNTLHLHLQPGEDTIHDLGGIHRFMSWPRPILSDSGGFQVWSLGKIGKKKDSLNKITEEGVFFQSPLDGSSHFLSPEKSIEIQYKLGTDIIMAFDECTPDSDDKNYVRKAMERTHRWAKRSLLKHQELKKIKESRGEKAPLLFGIIQGGNFEDLRKESAKFITSLPFAGIALGGETIGYNMPQTLKIIDYLQDYLPENKPRYTMGLGSSPNDIIEVVKRGIDMFDCVSPARMARHGALYSGKISLENGEVKFTSEFPKGYLRISNSRFKNDDNPIDEDCDCYTCQHFSRAYLHHLYLTQETLYLRLATIHNLSFMMRLIHFLRDNI